jgi:hypothetical protein
VSLKQARNGRRLGQHFSGVFQQIKVAGKQEESFFYTSRLQKNEEIGEIFVLISKEH